MMIMYCYWK